MNARAILIASDGRVRTEIRNMFRGDQQVMLWAADPNEWEIYEAGYIDPTDGYTFEDILEDGAYEANEEEIPVAVAYLKPADLETQVVYPIYDRNGVDVIGEYNGD